MLTSETTETTPEIIVKKALEPTTESEPTVSMADKLNLAIASFEEGNFEKATEEFTFLVEQL